MTTVKKPISVTISDYNIDFINIIARKLNISKSFLFDKILSEYKKQYLAYELSKDASLDWAEGLNEVNADFWDYIKMIHEES